jgi:hypothetical protein
VNLTKPRRLLGTAALAGALALTAAACGSSSKSTAAAPATTAAASDQVNAIAHLTGQGTTVTLDPSTAAALTKLGVKVTPYGTAQAENGGSAVMFPITSGYAEIHGNHNYKPGYVVGSIEHAGSGLTFTAGAKSVTVSDFVVDPGNSMLYATVGNQQAVPLLSLDGTNLKVSMQGGDVVLDGTVAKLTQTAASALNQAFGTSALTPGTPLGTVHLVAAGALTSYNEATDHTTEVSRVSGQSTSVALDPTTAGALTKLGVTVTPTGTGTFDKASSTLSFPITGGVAVIHSNKSAQPGYIDGVLLHQGSGLQFSAGGKTLTLNNFIVDPGDSTLVAEVGGQQNVPIANLDGTPLQVSQVNGTVHLDGTLVKLTPQAAQALDTTFGTTAVTPGLLLGTAHIIVSGS